MPNATVSCNTPDDVDSRCRGAFDELCYVPPDELQEDYFAAVSCGYDRLRQSRVVIAGLARDVEQVLPRTIERIERQGQFCRDYRVVIYENDSSDGTPWMLQSWAAQNSRVTVISENRDDPVNLPSRCLSRASRMAYYRSQCQKLIASEYAHFDHVLLVDTDLAGGWSYDGVAHTFGCDDWDFVGANGIIYRRRWLCPNAVAQYDAWAYRDDLAFTPLSTKSVNRLQFRRGQPLQFVYSCFGGVGIYRMPAYLAGRYDGSDVEHVTFHRELHRRGFTRTYLNPNLIAVYGRKYRSMDRLAARVLKVTDYLPIVPTIDWQFGCEPQTTATAPSSPQPSKRAA